MSTNKPAVILPDPPRAATMVGFVLTVAVAIAGWFSVRVLPKELATFLRPELLPIHALMTFTIVYLIGLYFRLRADDARLTRLDPLRQPKGSTSPDEWYDSAVSRVLVRLRRKWAVDDLTTAVSSTRGDLEDRLNRRWIWGLGLAALLPLAVSWWGAVRLQTNSNAVPWRESFAALVIAVPETLVVTVLALLARRETRALTHHWADYAEMLTRSNRLPGTLPIPVDATLAEPEPPKATSPPVAATPTITTSPFDQLWDTIDEQSHDSSDPSEPARASKDPLEADDFWGGDSDTLTRDHNSESHHSGDDWDDV